MIQFTHAIFILYSLNEHQIYFIYQLDLGFYGILISFFGIEFPYISDNSLTNPIEFLSFASVKLNLLCFYAAFINFKFLHLFPELFAITLKQVLAGQLFFLYNLLPSSKHLTPVLIFFPNDRLLHLNFIFIFLDKNFLLSVLPYLLIEIVNILIPHFIRLQTIFSATIPIFIHLILLFWILTLWIYFHRYFIVSTVVFKILVKNALIIPVLIFIEEICLILTAFLTKILTMNFIWQASQNLNYFDFLQKELSLFFAIIIIRKIFFEAIRYYFEWFHAGNRFCYYQYLLINYDQHFLFLMKQFSYYFFWIQSYYQNKLGFVGRNSHSYLLISKSTITQIYQVLQSIIIMLLNYPIIITSLVIVVLGQNICTLQNNNIPCPILDPICPYQSTVVIPSDIIYSCDYALNISANNIQLQGGKYPSLNLSAQNIGIEGVVSVTDSIYLEYNYQLSIKGNISVKNKFLINVNTSTSQYIATSINIEQSNIGTNIFFAQASFNFNVIDSTINIYQPFSCLQSILGVGNYSLYLQNYQPIDFMSPTFSSSPFDIYFLAGSLMNISNSTMNGGIIFLNSLNYTNIVGSTVNTSGRGCPSNSGLGRGLTVQLGNQSCKSGSSSSGYGVISDKANCESVLQYFMFLTHSFPYLTQGPYISTGSGGSGFNGTGAGGGIIFIYSLNVFNNEKSFFQANGLYVSEESDGSAGSGGSVFIYAQNFTGYANNYSSKGGASYNNKGAGAGGIVKISFANLNITGKGLLWVNVSQGYQNLSNDSKQLISNGLFYGLLCPYGQYLDYFGCLNCTHGSYNSLGDSRCRPCPAGNNILQIDYQAQKIVNVAHCYMPMNQQEQIWISPGTVSFLSILIYLGCLILTIIIALIISYKLKQKKKKLQKQSLELQFDFQTASKDFVDNQIITDNLKNQKKFKLADLMYHLYRLTIFGVNSYRCPWQLPARPPSEIKSYILRQGYTDFANKFNKIAKWTKKQMWLCRLAMLFYPLYWYYYIKIKKQKYKKVLALFDEEKEYNFINNYDFQDRKLVLVKFSKNKDYTLCYLDFFMYDKADMKYFTLSSPFITWLSGQGTFLRPFYLCAQDIFLNALFFIINRSLEKKQQMRSQRQKLLGNLVGQRQRQQNSYQLNNFIKKFNRIIQTLDRSAPLGNFLDTLQTIISILDSQNVQFFNKCLVNMNLIMMITQKKQRKSNPSKKLYQDVYQEKETTISILTNKDPDKFKAFIKYVKPLINLNNRIDIKFGIFVYNPEQEITLKTDNLSKNQLKENYLTEFGQSEIEGENEEQLLNSNAQIQISYKNTIVQKAKRFIELIRYQLFTHRLCKIDKYMVKFLQTLLILFQTMLVFIWSIKVQPPYVFVNAFSPFLGIVWCISDSYGIGKLFLILNALSLLNNICAFILYMPLQASLRLQVGLCQLLHCFLTVCLVLVGCRGIFFSRKIGNPEMFT